MKIALCSSFIPFVNGGARNIVEWLQSVLQEHGHHVERIYLPEADTPELLLRQFAAFRWIDLDAADRVICFRPQAHLVPHPNKVLWFIHHIRQFYDLWGTPYGFENTAANRKIRDNLIAIDNKAFLEAKAVFTNSQAVSDRLKSFNSVDSEVLYPPVFRPERFFTRTYNDEIVYICRVEHHKRQHLMIEAMQYTKTAVRLRLCGTSGNPDYPRHLEELISKYRLSERVTLENRWIAEDEKAGYLADCLAAAYIPVDEDSYGYPSVEACHAKKSVITTSDSGGVLELVKDGYNGVVAEPDPKDIAQAMDRLYHDLPRTQKLGRNAFDSLNQLNISWSHVVDRLLA